MSKKDNITLMQFFPVNAWSLKIKRTKKQKDALMKEIKKIKEEQIGNNKSNYGGYHSPLFKYYDLIGTPFEFIYDHIVSVINERIIPQTITHIKNQHRQITKENISALWFIINKEGDHNVIHTHPPGWLAGSYYVSVPKDSGSLVFHDCVPERKHQFMTNVSASIEPQENHLYLFPAWFPHSVKENKSNKERIVISFNIGRPDYIEKQ